MNCFNRKITALCIVAMLFLVFGSIVYAADGDDNYGEWDPDWESSEETEVIITEQPNHLSVKPGERAAFTVRAVGSELRYQWYYQKSTVYGGTDYLIWKGHTTASTSAIANETWDGMRVYCKITDKNGKTVDSATAEITTVVPLEITGQPCDISVRTGEIATFSVKATGKRITCQWYYKKNGAEQWSLWKGHNTFTTKAAANATWDGMQVFCEIKDASGDACSSASAQITLTDPLEITGQPSNVIASVGDTVHFSVIAQGIGLKYQWYFRKAGVDEWSIWKNHTTADTLAVANGTWDGMQVYCRIQDSSGKCVLSDSALIKLDGFPIILTQSADVQTKAGDTVKFTVKAQGSRLQYQWYYKKNGAKYWSIWKKHTTAATTAIANDTWNGMQVYCIVTDGFGRSVSSLPCKIELI